MGIYLFNFSIHLYQHFYTEGHSGIKDLSVQIIHITDVHNPNERESFWIEKLNTYIPMGLNVRGRSIRVIYAKHKLI